MPSIKSIAVIAAAAVCILFYRGSFAADERPQPHRAMTRLAVGDFLPAAVVHHVREPGRYGLGPGPADGVYAVAYGRLVRIDPSDMQVLSILREQPEILD